MMAAAAANTRSHWSAAEAEEAEEKGSVRSPPSRALAQTRARLLEFDEATTHDWGTTTWVAMADYWGEGSFGGLEFWSTVDREIVDYRPLYYVILCPIHANWRLPAPRLPRIPSPPWHCASRASSV